MPNCHCNDRDVPEWNGMGLGLGFLYRNGRGCCSARGVRVAMALAVVKAYDK